MSASYFDGVPATREGVARGSALHPAANARFSPRRCRWKQHHDPVPRSTQLPLAQHSPIQLLKSSRKNPPEQCFYHSNLQLRCCVLLDNEFSRDVKFANTGLSWSLTCLLPRLQSDSDLAMATSTREIERRA